MRSRARPLWMVPEPAVPDYEPKIIRILCPNLLCRRVLAVPANARGKLVRCRGCGITVSIPQQGKEGDGRDKETAA